MGTGRRLTVLLLALALIGIPAAVLRIGCVGNSCRSDAAAVAAPAPFCSLPTDLRTLITSGTYDGRSPDVLGVAGSTPVVSDGVPWPSETSTTAAGAVDLSFVGRGVRSTRLPPGVSLDQVAPTLEPLLGLHRAHPEVRAGTAIPGVDRPGAHTPLVVLVVSKGIGRADLGRSPHPTGRPVEPGLGDASGSAVAGSAPLDPVAVEATIGTGGLPSQHGITGAEIRDSENGKVVRAFGPGSPQPVIATLGDDLDLATHGAARIGLVASAVGDAGLTGDAWYGTGPVRDRTVSGGAHPDAAVRGFLERGWGADATPDLLAVALSGSALEDERAGSAIVDEVLRAVPDATIVLTGTGSTHASHAQTLTSPAGADSLSPGGIFLDRSAGATTSAQDVVDALKADTAPDGSPLFADAFASYAVRFGRYC
jgi:hypothetical protein